jgi:methionyl-tRNA formyltransferase
LKILIASSSDIAIPLIENIVRNGQHEFCGLLSNIDKATGRGQSIRSNDLAEWAKNSGVRIYQSGSTNDIREIVNEVLPDVVITIAFGQIIKEDSLRIPKNGWLNVHFSNLPEWRGAAPVQHAILNGESSTGISIFQLEKGMDTGPVYLFEEVIIQDNEKTPDVLKKMSLMVPNLVLKTLEMISGNIPPIPQSGENTSYASKISKEDGMLDWNNKSLDILNKFRAFYGNPGVWTILNENRIIINNMRISLQENLFPGQVLISADQLVVGTAHGAIEILELTPAGRKTMSASEFIRGLLVKDGLKLG